MKKYIIVIVFILFVILLFLYYNRSFYSNEKGQYFTIWRPIGGQSYIIKGKYFSPFKPNINYVALYSSKHVYFCENCPDKITLNLGSRVIRKNGLDDFYFLNHKDFFDKYKGASYENGKFVKDDSFDTKNTKFKIKHIDL